MRDLTWPQAFVIVFGGLPALFLLLAVLTMYPAVTIPAYSLSLAVFVWRVQSARRDAARRHAAELADRADMQHAMLCANLATYGLRTSYPSQAPHSIRHLVSGHKRTRQSRSRFAEERHERAVPRRLPAGNS